MLSALPLKADIRSCLAGSVLSTDGMTKSARFDPPGMLPFPSDNAWRDRPKFRISSFAPAHSMQFYWRFNAMRESPGNDGQ